MGVAQAMKRIPRIKFPQRHPKPSSGSTSKPQQEGANDDVSRLLLSRITSSNKSSGGRASEQPRRTPVSAEEIETILLGGCP
ncbi:uncharacterized protein LOC124910363 [Impatiens glandulifera]|uniref:uncharacterized protein LOC124910363 n=1 Tax=Impatiens glandulifera TaxID=253017 RepID=UPI001FB0C943|nr:uncharacterized protein LOC124910363 [Impatiens glandulifera]